MSSELSNFDQVSILHKANQVFCKAAKIIKKAMNNAQFAVLGRLVNVVEFIDEPDLWKKNKILCSKHVCVKHYSQPWRTTSVHASAKETLERKAVSQQ